MVVSRVFFVVILAAAALAGCAGDEPALTAESVPSAGQVAGIVADDVGRLLAAAHVSLLGGDAFGDTDASGRFLLASVPARTYRLQVQATGFQVHQADVEVPVNATAWHNVTLLPDADVGPGSRAHIHDLWAGQERVVLMDEPFSLTEQEPGRRYVAAYETALWAAVRPNQANAKVIPWPDGDGRPALVYPGTAEVEVTLDWSPQDTTVDALGLRYVTAARSEPIVLSPRAPGMPFIIPVAPGETDTGHQAFTLWEFAIVYPYHPVSAPASFRPTVSLGEMHVKIEIVRGGDPLPEPAHPDLWASGDELDLTPDAPLTVTYASEVFTSRRSMHLEDGSIVPPGTTRLRFEFSWTSGPADDAVRPERILFWRSADQNPQRTPLDEWHHVAPVEATGKSQVYEIAVERHQTDAFYQSRSNWEWLPAVPGSEDEDGDLGVSPRTFLLEVTAFRDAAGPAG